MEVRMNAKMREVLANLEIEDVFSVDSDLPRASATLLEQGIIHIHDLYLLRALTSDARELDQHSDLTDVECSINHVHMEWHVDDQRLHDISRVAIRLATEIANLLTSNYPSEEFYVVVGIDEDDFHTVRFYKVREDEPPWVRVDMLDEYIDGILVISTKCTADVL